MERVCTNAKYRQKEGMKEREKEKERGWKDIQKREAKRVRSRGRD